MKKLITILFAISSLSAEIVNLTLLDTINISKTQGQIKSYIDNNESKGKIILDGIYKMQFQSHTNTIIEINWFKAKYNNSSKDINLRTALSSDTNIIASSVVKAKGDLKYIYELRNLMKIKAMAKKEVEKLAATLNKTVIQSIIIKLNKKIDLLNNRILILEKKNNISIVKVKETLDHNLSNITTITPLLNDLNISKFKQKDDLNISLVPGTLTKDKNSTHVMKKTKLEKTDIIVQKIKEEDKKKFLEKYSRTHKMASFITMNKLAKTGKYKWQKFYYKNKIVKFNAKEVKEIKLTAWEKANDTIYIMLEKK